MLPNTPSIDGFCSGEQQYHSTIVATLSNRVTEMSIFWDSPVGKGMQI